MSAENRQRTLLDVAEPVAPTQRRLPLPDEQAIVARAGRGDHDAFRLLVDRYGGAILALCSASTLRREEAEELTQDVLLAAWRGLARFRGDASFSTWLFALARNRVIDHARRAAVRPQLAPSDEDTGLYGHHLDAHEASSTARAVLAACAKLPLAKRQALLLRDLHGLAYSEIAAIQDVPIGTVRSRIAEARSIVAKDAVA